MELKHVTITGLEKLKQNSSLQKFLNGNIGYLCHDASVDSNFQHGVYVLKAIFEGRLKKLFSPQHGIFGDAQDDMIESDHFHHAGFDLSVYSLYSETRKPTKKMLTGLNQLIVDLQDVGTRVYTYLYTLALTMKACGENDVEVIVLDRPNPINGEAIEGNLLDLAFTSFVGMFPIPMRHGLTIGEFALMLREYWHIDCKLRVIPMEGWNRRMYFDETGLPWVHPSPNLPNIATALVYPGTVLFEGTNLSEGRGTTKSLEIIGHPNIEPYSISMDLEQVFQTNNLNGFVLRPVYFTPTFQKFKNIPCGGFQIHVTDKEKFKPWKTGQLLCRELYHYLGKDFKWKLPPFEYEYEKWPVDILNGTDKIRKWVETRGELGALKQIEEAGMDAYLDLRNEILLY